MDLGCSIQKEDRTAGKSPTRLSTENVISEKHIFSFDIAVDPTPQFGTSAGKTSFLLSGCCREDGQEASESVLICCSPTGKLSYDLSKVR